MKVFISWSGDMSRELAESFRNWLPSVLQAVKPYFTPDDVDKGARWNKEISVELENSSIGIFCLTRENILKPWIMFEAGALSKSVDNSKVCPILFGIDNSDIQGPLVQFQATRYCREEIEKLLKTVNALLGEQKLSDTVFDEVFEMWWPKLDNQVQQILKKHEESSSGEAFRSDRSILEEILALSRNASRRSMRRPRLHPGAVRDLIEATSDIYQKIASKEDNTDLMPSLKQLRKATRYIIDMSDADIFSPSFRSHALIADEKQPSVEIEEKENIRFITE